MELIYEMWPITVATGDVINVYGTDFIYELIYEKGIHVPLLCGRNISYSERRCYVLQKPIWLMNVALTRCSGAILICQYRASSLNL